MRPKICATLAAESIDQVLVLSHAAEVAGADLLELRLDYLKDHDGIADFIRSTKMPTILTLRKREEGGKFEGKEEERVELLLRTADEGFKYADVELSTLNVTNLAEELRSKGVNVIISHHNFESTPSVTDMLHTVERELACGANVCKLVTMANQAEDNLRCLELVARAREKTKVVCFAMGHLGVMSRVYSPLFGAFFTFASPMKGREAAPGQLTVYEMRQVYRLLGLE